MIVSASNDLVTNIFDFISFVQLLEVCIFFFVLRYFYYWYHRGCNFCIYCFAFVSVKVTICTNTFINIISISNFDQVDTGEHILLFLNLSELVPIPPPFATISYDHNSNTTNVALLFDFMDFITSVLILRMSLVMFTMWRRNLSYDVVVMIWM